MDAAFGLELDYGGTPHRDVAKLGVKGIDLNGDGDVDITPDGPVRIYGLDGTGGNDLLSGAGSKATGGAVERPVSMFGGAGDDRLVGGRGNDFINEDFAETGDDVLIGGRGNDSLNGGGGKDTLHAGRGKDSLVADDGHRDLVDGGRGIDSFQYDHGLDVVRNKP